MCDGLAGRGPPPARTSTGLRVSGPTSGEDRHEPCPYGGGRGDWTPAPPLQRGALCVRREVMGFGGVWVCRGSCLRRNDGLTGWRGAGLPLLALRRSSTRASPHPGRAGTRPAPTEDGDTPSAPPLDSRLLGNNGGGRDGFRLGGGNDGLYGVGCEGRRWRPGGVIRHPRGN